MTLNKSAAIVNTLLAYLPNALNAAILDGKKKISKSSFDILDRISIFPNNLMLLSL
jgi:hypothetical protein